MNDDCVILLMPVRIPHEQEPNSIYFVTFTCYNWLPLFEITNSYDLIYKWFDYLYSKNIRVAGYVIMPNHIHLLLYFPEMTRFQKLDYIHHNPTNGKWSLAGDFISYKHSSASFYEHGVGGYERLMRIEEVM